MAIRDRIKEFRRVPARDLLPNPSNWRTHPDHQREALRVVLDQIGYAGAALCRETPEGLMLIDGHLRAPEAHHEWQQRGKNSAPDAETDRIVRQADFEPHHRRAVYLRTILRFWQRSFRRRASRPPLLRLRDRTEVRRRRPGAAEQAGPPAAESR